MRSRLTVSRLTLVCLVHFAFSTDTRAECFHVGPRSVFENTKAELIFAGTFRKKEVISRNTGFIEPVTGDGEQFLKDQTAFGMRLTFDVQHVWRVRAPKTLLVYQVLHPDSTDHWKPNHDYLILGIRLSDDDRRHLLLRPEEQGFIVTGCSGAWSWTRDVEKEARRGFGPGRRPE